MLHSWKVWALGIVVCASGCGPTAGPPTPPASPEVIKKMQQDHAAQGKVKPNSGPKGHAAHAGK